MRMLLPSATKHVAGPQSCKVTGPEGSDKAFTVTEQHFTRHRAPRTCVPLGKTNPKQLLDGWRDESQLITSDSTDLPFKFNCKD